MIKIDEYIEVYNEVRLTFDEYDTYGESILNKVKLLPKLSSLSEYGFPGEYIISWTECFENTTDLKTFLGG